MITCKNYVKAASLQEAWELNQKKSSILIGGMLWVKMGKRTKQTIIDLSDLGLDTIEETDGEFRIGCMASLRDIETHKGLNDYSQGAVRECVRHIVGVQFRNTATVGGSIFGRFGFSDVLTQFLAMDSYVELYKAGVVPMTEFVKMKRDRDILVAVIIKKTPGSFAYQSMRNAKTDFPTIAAAVSCMNGKVAASVGARPALAMLIPDAEGIMEGVRADGEEARRDKAAAFGEYVSAHTPTGSNMRGSAEYRSHLVKVLVKRACLEMMEDKA